MHHPPRSVLPLPLAGCCLALALALSACDADPTAPTSYVRETAGRTWVAVVEPEGLPDAGTWLPFVDPAHPSHARVLDMRTAAGKLRRAGHLERAADLETRAAELAAAAVRTSPGPEAVLRCVGALERWTERAEARLETGAFPDLARSVGQVGELVAGARGAMQQGDTVAAVRLLTRAGERVHRHSPAAVALRVVGAAEARVEGLRDPSENVRRARHLLRGAREGLAMRDYRRALRRAVYALQLLDAEGIRIDAAADEGRADTVEAAPPEG